MPIPPCANCPNRRRACWPAAMLRARSKATPLAERPREPDAAQRPAARQSTRTRVLGKRHILVCADSDGVIAGRQNTCVEQDIEALAGNGVCARRAVDPEKCGCQKAS